MYIIYPVLKKINAIQFTVCVSIHFAFLNKASNDPEPYFTKQEII